jgi:DNA-binding transcriptional ArsR family regulator
MSNTKLLKPLSEAELSHLAGRFKLLGEPMRLKILQSVCHKPRTVNEIVEATGSTQANVSKHLTLLATAGILEREKAGQWVYYGMRDKLVLQLCELVRAQIVKSFDESRVSRR